MATKNIQRTLCFTIAAKLSSNFNKNAKFFYLCALLLCKKNAKVEKKTKVPQVKCTHIFMPKITLCVFHKIKSCHNKYSACVLAALTRDSSEQNKTVGNTATTAQY